jgi:hypothetical protein
MVFRYFTLATADQLAIVAFGTVAGIDVTSYAATARK